MRVAIVGSGYVGLTTAVCLARLGHTVRCVDVLEQRVGEINAGQAPFYEPGFAELLSTAIATGRLRATTRVAEAVQASEVTFIAVGTPEGERGIDLSFVAQAAREIGQALRDTENYHVVVVKSTVVPGTTDTLVRTLLEEHSSRRTGEFGLCMNPEFLREGSAVADFLDPDRIVIGQWDERSGMVVAELYRSFQCPVLFTTPRNAEMTKYASNALLATLISFSNEIAALCEATPGADVQEVMRALHFDRRLTPVVDGQPIRPGILSFLWAGCGFGGSCLPKDVNALRAFAREREVGSGLLDAVMTVNQQRPYGLVDLVEQAVGSLSDTTVAVLGLAFKPGTDDVRRSPAIPVVDELVRRGAFVRAYDPILTTRVPLRQLGPLVVDCNGSVGPVVSRSTPADALRDADAAVIVTACPEFLTWDWSDLCATMRRPIVVDGRNALSGLRWPSSVRYIPIGRAFRPEEYFPTVPTAELASKAGDQ